MMFDIIYLRITLQVILFIAILSCGQKFSTSSVVIILFTLAGAFDESIQLVSRLLS